MTIDYQDVGEARKKAAAKRKKAELAKKKASLKLPGQAGKAANAIRARHKRLSEI